ncbi:hypothetical protein K501DRAFT_283107 [Backusella circina FSU 941]|nr:hypothetical protein K501DRAFT_283107 [Backusella circina FSU 941]
MMLMRDDHLSSLVSSVALSLTVVLVSLILKLSNDLYVFGGYYNLLSHPKRISMLHICAISFVASILDILSRS